ncbi:acyl-CoA dehydrogenase family protein [Streptomyces noursei]|nr:acyl-CoA dehydrogenase family protein [Streptomyces noursei]
MTAGRAVAAFALSEPGAGSDAAALALAAEPDGPGRWRLSGEKCWISNAPRPTSPRSSPAPAVPTGPAASPPSSSPPTARGWAASRWTCSARTRSAPWSSTAPR